MRNSVPKTFWKAYAGEVTRRRRGIATPVCADSPSHGGDPTTKLLLTVSTKGSRGCPSRTAAHRTQRQNLTWVVGPHIARAWPIVSLRFAL